MADTQESPPAGSIKRRRPWQGRPQTGVRIIGSKKQRTIFVTGFVPGLEKTAIHNFFSEYGTIKNITLDPKNGKFALVEYADKLHALKALNSQHILNGKKLIVQRKNKESEYDPLNDIKSAVISSLKHMESVEDQMCELPQILGLTDGDRQVRNAACDELYGIFKRFYPGCDIHVYGSSANGYGFKGCDLDVLFEPFPDYLDRFNVVRKGNTRIPSAHEVLNNLELLKQLPKESHLKFIKKILFGYSHHYENVVYINAKCPIVKMKFKQYNLECDISCSNRLVLWNTKLLRCYQEMDSRVLPLMMTLRCWAKLNQIIKIGNLSSYAFSLMVIFFLQNINPPVLPSVEYLRRVTDESHNVGGWETSFCTDLREIEPSSNMEAVDQLLWKFFNFYINFDYSRFVICPYNGQITDIYYFKNSSCKAVQNFNVSEICIQDPFELSRNVSSAKANTLVILLNALQAANKLCISDKFYTTGFLELFENTNFVPITVIEPAVHFTILFTGKLKEWFEKATKSGINNCAELCLMNASRSLLELLRYGYLINTEIVEGKETPTVRKRNLSSNIVDLIAKCPRIEQTDKSEKAAELSAAVKVLFNSPKKMENEHNKDVKMQKTETSLPLAHPSTSSKMPMQEASCSKRQKSSNTHVLLMSIQCTADKKVWRNRKVENQLRKSFGKTSLNALELEHSMSLKISETIEASLKNPIVFSCDLYDTSVGGLPQIFVVLTPIANTKDFKEISYFLKCNVPKTIEEILHL